MKKHINKSLIFDFRTKKISKVMDKIILFSDVILNGITELLSTIEKIEEMYIICPLYIQGDCQISVTGTSYDGFDPSVSTIKELSEEIGIVPINYDYLTYIGTYSHPIKTRPMRIVHNYTINAELCERYYNGHKCSKYYKHMTKNNENKDIKLQVLVYGSLQIIITLLKNVGFRHMSKDFNNIKQLRIIKITDLMDIIK